MSTTLPPYMTRKDVMRFSALPRDPNKSVYATMDAYSFAESALKQVLGVIKFLESDDFMAHFYDDHDDMMLEYFDTDLRGLIHLQHAAHMITDALAQQRPKKYAALAWEHRVNAADRWMTGT